MKNRIISIYPGRFQPFGKHHKNTFSWLQEQFGTENTFVVTSNKVDGDKSPFNFREKSIIIRKHGISKNNVIQVKSPYIAEELTSNYDENNTSVVFCVGKKDANRLGGKYFLPYKENKNNLKSFLENGYYIIAPHESVQLNESEVSGSLIREFFKSMDNSIEDKKKLFESSMGFYDEKLFKMINLKINKETI